MTAAQDEARRLLKGATPGQWEVWPNEDNAKLAEVVALDGDRCFGIVIMRTTSMLAEAALIAAAPRLLAALLDELHQWEMSDALQNDPDVQQHYIDSLTAERDTARRQMQSLTEDYVAMEARAVTAEARLMAAELDAKTWKWATETVTARADAAEARAAALTAAIVAHQDCCLTDFWPELREDAAAVQPPDSTPPPTMPERCPHCLETKQTGWCDDPWHTPPPHRCDPSCRPDDHRIGPATPPPSVCPTCGSQHPAVQGVRYTDATHTAIERCDNQWHGR